MLTIQSNDPAVPSYQITLNGEGVATQTPLEAWREQHFGSVSNSGNGADEADPNSNGIPNLIEYALGGDPAGGSTGGTILPTLVRDGAGRLQLRFTRYPARTGIVLAVQASAGLAGPWSDLATSVNGAAFGGLGEGISVNESGSGASRVVIFTDRAVTADDRTRFLRLKVVTGVP